MTLPTAQILPDLRGRRGRDVVKSRARLRELQLIGCLVGLPGPGADIIVLQVVGFRVSPMHNPAVDSRSCPNVPRRSQYAVMPSTHDLNFGTIVLYTLTCLHGNAEAGLLDLICNFHSGCIGLPATFAPVMFHLISTFQSCSRSLEYYSSWN